MSRRLWACWFAALLLGCAATDAGVIVAEDAGVDAPLADAGLDGSETGPDAEEADAASDSGGDAGEDGADDAADADVTDGGDGDAPVAVCGNGRIEAGEDCDDDNLRNGDGCDAQCAFEPTGPDDVCPGSELSFTGSSTLTATVRGDSSGRRNQYSSACGGGSGPDVVHSLTSPVTGRATATLLAAFESVLSARARCSDDERELACESNVLDPSRSLTISFPVRAGEVASLVIDGYGGASGEYLLTVTLDPAACGNGAAEFPEQCDDGNVVGGDGCAADCTLENAGALDRCPGLGYQLKGTDPSLPRSISIGGSTIPLADDYPASLFCFTSKDGSDAVYAITPDADGALEVVARAQVGGLVVRVLEEQVQRIKT